MKKILSRIKHWLSWHGYFGKVTMMPSIGNFNLPCKLHYFLIDNKVEWL